MNKKYLNIFRNLILITIGTVIFSLTVKAVVIPNGLGEGGVTGLTVLLYYLFEISPSLTMFFANAVILSLGWRLLDRTTVFYTIYAVVMMSLFLRILPEIAFLPQNSLVAAITAGVGVGIGIGFTILGHGSTAGSDIIALIINKYTGIPVASALMGIDVFVVLSLYFAIGSEAIVLTLVTIFITSKVITFMIEGLNPKKQVMIISNYHERIALEIDKNIGRGITIFHGEGYYSGDDKRILSVVVDRFQLMPLQRIVHEIDPNAFVTITNMHQVIGEGFTFFLEQ